MEKRLQPGNSSARAVAWFCAAMLAVAAGVAQEPENLPETQAPPPLHRASVQNLQSPAPSKPSPSQAATNPLANQPAPDAQPARETPSWPVNDQPSMAAVTWDAHGLSIDAANSSLQQILKDISTATGATVEGLNSDERVFGEYGPGQARDVLSQLLQGAGYNVLMIGDQGSGAPRQILLTAKREGDQRQQTGNNQSTNNDDDSVDSDNDEQNQPPMRPPFQGGPRSPQQMMQERQERMERMRQQLQQNAPQPQSPVTPSPQN